MASAESCTANSKPTSMEKLNEQRRKLPIYHYRDMLLQVIERVQVLVIVGESRCGKTTQIPQYLHEAGYTKGGEKKIGITLPRGVTHIMPTVAARVAEELGLQVGHEVVYSTANFFDQTSNNVLIKYMKEEILVRERFESEADLESYSVVMVDEAQERTLSTDILFKLLKDITLLRPSDFKLIISCSTDTDAKKLSKYFDEAPIFAIPQRRRGFQKLFMKNMEEDLVNAVVAKTLEIHVTKPHGDILAFLPGQQEIKRVDQLLKQITNARCHNQLVISPISAQSFEATPQGVRKVVLATNMAETSLLMFSDIEYIIDSGFCAMKSCDPTGGVESMRVSPISKAMANQRADQAVKCFRLYTCTHYNRLQDQIEPEVRRSNLASVVLMLKSLGFLDMFGFGFLDPPAPEALGQALEQLIALGALDHELGQLTEAGKQMAATISLFM